MHFFFQPLVFAIGIKRRMAICVDQALREVEALLNRLSIFRGAQQVEAAEALEPFVAIESVVSAVDEEILRTAFQIVSDPDDVPDVVVKVLLQLLANSCVSDDDQVNRRILNRLGIAQLCERVLVSRARSAACCYAVLDVISTISTNNSELRRLFASSMPKILECMKANKLNLELLFGACCALATLTLADFTNAHSLIAAGGFTMLLEVYKFAAKQQHNLATKLTTPNAFVGISSEALTAEEVSGLLCEIQSWAKATLTNIIRVPDPEIDAVLQKASFGRFGDLIPVDELKWHLTSQRRRTMQKEAAALQ